MDSNTEKNGKWLMNNKKSLLESCVVRISIVTAAIQIKGSY